MKLQILAFFAAAPCFAQFYAPPTDFHDSSQRVFPVEAARVIAWQLREPAVDHISYQVAQTAKGEVTWKISWDSSDGKPVRTAIASYKEAELLDGPKWFRSVWRQLRGPVPTPAKPPSDPLGEFWRAHAGAGISRTECIAESFKATEPYAKNMSDTDAAKVAGCLTRALAASCADEIFLGAVISARAAAWLCTAEDLYGAPLASPWIPVLVASNRQAQAADIFKKAPKELAGTEPVKWMWRTLITMPHASQALVEAVANRECAGPVFELYGNMEPAYNEVWAEIADKLWPGKLKDRMSDYGSSLIWARKAHHPQQDIPMRTLKTWLDALDKAPPQTGDSQLVRKLAATGRAAISGKNDLKTAPPSVIELLSLGARVNTDGLRPVAVATQEDLITLGWESAGKQIAAIHARMGSLAGYGEQTIALVAAWPTAVDGWDAFFRLNDKDKAKTKPLADSGRYEFTVFGNVGRHLGATPPAAWGKDPFAHFKRRWLLDPHRALISATDGEGDKRTTEALLRRSIAEGSAHSLGPLGEQWRNDDIDEVVDELGFRAEVARAVPASLYSARMTMEAAFYKKRAPLTYARALEKLEWDSGLTFATKDVMLAYAEANAVADAIRIFEQTADAIPNWMDRLAGMQIAVGLALIEGKDDQALAFLDKYEKEDRFGLRFDYALARGDEEGVRKAAEIHKAHFPKSSRLKNMEQTLAWFPLYPALREPKHPDHKKALAEFPRSRGMQLSQWLVFTRAKLPEKSATEFFESEASEDADKLIIAAFNKDAALFEKLYTEGVPTIEELNIPGGRAVIVVRGFPFTSRGSSGTDALMSWLRGQLSKQPLQPKPTDLRPPGAAMLFPKLRALLETPPAK